MFSSNYRFYDRDNGVKRLTIVVDNPPTIAKLLFPPLDQRLADVSLVHFGVANERHHTAFRAMFHPAMRLDVVLDQ